MILASTDLDQETWEALVEENILLEGTAKDIKIIGNNDITLEKYSLTTYFTLN